MSRIHLLIVAMIFSSVVAEAGYEVGNGGHAVVCRDPSGQISSAEALDLYEMRERYGWNLSPVRFSGSIEQNVMAYFNRLGAFSPVRTATYNSFVKNFFADTRYSAKPLDVIHDYADAVVPAGCHLEQVVKQTDYYHSSKNGFRYLINQEIWQKLEPTSQQAVILHETMYREFVDAWSGIAGLTSKRLRQFVGLILSNEIENLTSDEVQKFLTDEFPHVELDGVLFRGKSSPGPSGFWSRMGPSERRSGDAESVCYYSLMRDSFVSLENQWIPLAPGNRVCVYDYFQNTHNSLQLFHVRAGGSLNARLLNGHELTFISPDELEQPPSFNLLGMRVYLSSANRGEVTSIGPFLPISFSFGNDSLQLIEIEFDDRSINGHNGVKVVLEQEALIKRKNYNIKLNSNFSHEFHQMSGQILGHPRSLTGEGTVFWKGQWKKFVFGTLYFDSKGLVKRVCEYNTGAKRCW